MAPNSVCWNITSRCNDNCAFCYREQNCRELPVQKQKEVIDKVAQAGIRKITFAGGEPLLLPQIHQLIMYARQKGLIVSLTTNGILLEGNESERRFFFRNLDWLTLSLDGSNEQVQSQMGRNTEHIRRVKSILELAAQDSKRTCRIKINTVVSRVNWNDMDQMAEFIKKYPVDRWKLFQFTPVRGNAVKYQEKYQITDETFQRIATDIQKRAGNKLIVSLSDHENIESAYFVIFPNGDIRISNLQNDRVVGNALTDNLEELWEHCGFKKDLHEKRTSQVFTRNRWINHKLA